MAANAPVKIGTRGTVGSLVLKEIEYFSKLELDRRGNARKPQASIMDLSSGNSHSRHGFWFLVMTWRRKKPRGSSRRFLPSLCAAVDEVAHQSDRVNRISGFNYRILENDVKKLHV